MGCNRLPVKWARIAAGAAALFALAVQPAATQPAPPPPGPGQTDAPPAPPPGPGQASAPPAVVNTNVNLRQGPGTNYTVITTLPAGTPVDVGNCGGQWCQVSAQGQNGYVIASSLGQGGPPPGGPPPGYAPPPVYYGPPPYYGPYPYYPGYGPYYGWRGGYGWHGGYGGWHRHW
jgi:hypothetical protein